MIQHAGVPALRIAFTIAVLAMSGVGLYTFQKRHQLFDQDPEVDTDTAVARHNRIAIQTSRTTCPLSATIGSRKSFLSGAA